jgi:hypothetical protein
MTYPEFLEAFVRIALFLFSEEGEGKEFAHLPVHEKLQHLLQRVLPAPYISSRLTQR